MKNKTKILIGVLALAMLLLAACSPSTPATSPAASPSPSPSPSESPSPTTIPAEIDEAAFTTVEEGLLVMGTNAEFPPYEFWEGSEIVGIDAEIAGAIAEKLGLTLRIDDMEFGSIIAAVNAGRIDIGMAGMTVTEERLLSVNFSTSYAMGVQVIIVKEDSAITGVDDLFADDASFDIGVQESTTGDLYATWDLEEEGLATIYRYPRGIDAVMALIADRVDCVIIDNEPAKAFVAANPGLKILETEFAVENYAIALAKSNEALLEAINAALEELIEDGTVQAIIDKYINTD